MATMEYLREEACSSDIVSLYPLQRILWQQKTAFADAVIAEVPTLGACLFLDGEIQSSAADEDIYHECLVHPAMSAAYRRGRVLIVGGGEGATVREVLKWSDVGHVDWVDIDGEVVEACKEHLQWGQDAAYTDPRVDYHAKDIRHFLHEDHAPYDVILLDLPDPDPDADPTSKDVLMNTELWEAVQHHLAEGGVWATHCGPVRRHGPSGLSFMYRTFQHLGWNTSTFAAYHAVIPAFQDDWGFLMSRSPLAIPAAPALAPASAPSSVRFLTPQALVYIFMWAWDPLLALRSSALTS